MSRVQTPRLVRCFVISILPSTLLMLPLTATAQRAFDIGVRLIAPDADATSRARLTFIAFCLANNAEKDACWLDPSIVAESLFRGLVEIQNALDANPAVDLIENSVRERIDEVDWMFQKEAE